MLYSAPRRSAPSAPTADYAAEPLDHPDNLLGTGALPADLDGTLRADGIRFATRLTTSNGHTFLLCGCRSPNDAGVDMLRDALQVRQCVSTALEPA